DFMTKAKQVEQCLGVFSWEPQSYGGWKNYGKGMFDDSGKPTSAFNAFKR
ncbi:arabinogalactan endo-1,4-beta-galactosidase, partial [Bacteroides ovatus]